MISSLCFDEDVRIAIVDMRILLENFKKVFLVRIDNCGSQSDDIFVFTPFAICQVDRDIDACACLIEPL